MVIKKVFVKKIWIKKYVVKKVVFVVVVKLEGVEWKCEFGNEMYFKGDMVCD